MIQSKKSAAFWDHATSHASLLSRVATNRNVLGEPDRVRLAARTRLLRATECRLVPVPHNRPMAQIGASLAHPLSHAQVWPLLSLHFHHLIAGQYPAFDADPARHPRWKPMWRLAWLPPRQHGRCGCGVHAAPGGHAAPFQPERVLHPLLCRRSHPRVRARVRLRR
jgi:hypothetical protein